MALSPWFSQTIHLLSVLTSQITSAAYHPSNCLLITASRDRTMRLFDLHVPGDPQVALVDTHLSVLDIALSHSGDAVCALAQGSGLQRIMVFQLANTHLLEMGRCSSYL